MEKQDQGIQQNDVEPQGIGNDQSDALAVNPPVQGDNLANETALLRDKAEAMRVALVGNMATLAAQRIGARAERVGLLIRLCNLDGIDPSLADADHKIEMALRAALYDVPEWAALQDTGGGGGNRRLASAVGSQVDRIREDFRQGMKC